MSGALSRNKDKNETGASESWPDYKGSVRIEGRDFWLSGWIKDGPHGKFLSLAVKPKEERAEPRAPKSYDEAAMPF